MKILAFSITILTFQGCSQTIIKEVEVIKPIHHNIKNYNIKDYETLKITTNKNTYKCMETSDYNNFLSMMKKLRIEKQTLLNKIKEHNKQ
jgi:hypothetical protein